MSGSQLSAIIAGITFVWLMGARIISKYRKSDPLEDLCWPIFIPLFAIAGPLMAIWYIPEGIMWLWKQRKYVWRALVSMGLLSIIPFFYFYIPLWISSLISLPLQLIHIPLWLSLMDPIPELIEFKPAHNAPYYINSLLELEELDPQQLSQLENLLIKHQKGYR